MRSQAGVVGIRDHAVYCASKGGGESAPPRCWPSSAPRGVTVNAVGPTFIYTPGTAGLDHLTTSSRTTAHWTSRTDH